MPCNCSQNVSPNSKMLFRMIKCRASRIARIGQSGNLERLRNKYVEIALMASLVGMLVYMDTASAVQREQCLGKVRLINCCFNSKELLK